MKYDFDELIDRRQTGSIKWSGSPNELPMWVADMDFKAAPAIIEALHQRIDHGVFGYTEPDDDWFNAYHDYYFEYFLLTRCVLLSYFDCLSCYH